MPIYAYRCDACGHAKDVLQKFSDAPLTQCPACGRDSFAKVLTAPAFQLKGSGWYVTDFRDNGKAKSGDPAAGNASGDGGATDTAGAADPGSANPGAGGDARRSEASPAATAGPAPAPASTAPSPASTSASTSSTGSSPAAGA
jgi:putative FmdB family regulatory protein